MDDQGEEGTGTKRIRLPVLDQDPLAPKAKMHGELGRCGSAANFYVGGTGCGFSEGDTEGTRGDTTATVKSHLPDLGQELPALREKTHGKLLKRRSSANLVSAKWTMAKRRIQ
jgi:hypothetical protein